MESRVELEEKYQNICNKIEELEQKLIPTKEKLNAHRLLDLLNIHKNCLKNITDFNVKSNYNELSSGEYELSRTGYITIVYDYKRPNDGSNVNIEYTVSTSYQETYENRYNPHKEANITLKVKGHGEYSQNDGLLDCIEDDGHGINWTYLLNEIVMSASVENPENPIEWMYYIRMLL